MPITLNDIEREIGDVASLPTLPVVAANLLEKLKSNAVSMQSISKIMENDPSITTKVLRVANSAYYSLRNRVDTIRMALVVLGVNEVTNVVLSLSIFKAFDKAQPDEHFDLNKFWFHSILTSQIARYLAKTLHIKTHGEEFTAGLIHGVGKILFLLYYPEQFKMVIKRSNSLKMQQYKVEKSTIGVTHMELGGWLAERWRLPNNLIECIRYYHNPGMSRAFKELISLVSLGNYYAKQLIDNNLTEDFSEFRQLEAWDILKSQRYLVDIKKFYTDLTHEATKAKEFYENILTLT